MRAKVGRQRKEILQASARRPIKGSSGAVAAAKLAKIEGLCDERDRLKTEEGGPTKGGMLRGRSW
jgi:hypothetical protein